MPKLQDLLISKVRVKILELFLQQPEEMRYVREITRDLKEEINAVRRELERMVSIGLLKEESRGNRKYFTVNTSYLFYPEFMRLIAKTTGLGKEIRKNEKKLGSLRYVMFTGRFATRLPRPNDEIDVLVIGEVVLPELDLLIKKEEQVRGREINYAVMSDEEFEFRKTRRDPFVVQLLELPRVMILGTEEKLLERKPALMT